MRRRAGVRESVGATWINIPSQGAGARVREHGLLKHPPSSVPSHTRTHLHTHKTTELLEAPADLAANPAAGQIDQEHKMKRKHTELIL